MKHLRRTFLCSLVPASVLSVLGLKANPSREQGLHSKIQRILDSGNQLDIRTLNRVCDAFLLSEQDAQDALTSVADLARDIRLKDGGAA